MDEKTKDANAEVEASNGDAKAKAEEFAGMVAEKTAEAIGEKFSSLEGSINGGFEKLIGALTKEPEEKTEEKEEEVSLDDAGNFAARMAKIEKEFGELKNQPKSDDLKAWDILKRGVDASDDPVYMRVKSAVERFDDTKTAALHRAKSSKALGMYGKPITHQGREINVPTQRRAAMFHAWAKFQTYPEHMSQHDEDIIQWIIHNEKFFVPNDRDDTTARMLTEQERHQLWNHHKSGYKALIDDSTSGGQEAVPEFFDTDGIILPVLGNELAPACTLIDVPRGSSVQSFTIGNPTFAAANTEGSAVSLFTTTSFVGDYNPSIFRAAGFIEVGRNFLQDAVPQMGQLILDRYMAKGAEWVDEQVAAGDGTTEPQGIINASGTADITLGTPTTGPWVIADVLNLLFGVSKEYRTRFPSSRAVFGMTDATYKRIRAIATGVTGDTRLIFGNDVESYNLFGHPVAILLTGLTDADAFFCQCGGYRLYRRQGLRMIREDRGDTLVRQSSVLLGADMRFAGLIERGGYAAVIDAAPTS